MTNERMTELMQNPEINELLIKTMFDNMEQQKTKAVKLYRMMNQFAKKGQILFVGSSLMEYFPINEMQNTLDLDRIIYNRGIAGTTTTDLLCNLEECIFELEPTKLFINIGTNDIGAIGENGYSKEKLITNYKKILDQIQKRLPNCQVYVMAYYPINGKADFGVPKQHREAMFTNRTNVNIMEANEAIKDLAKAQGFHFINVNDGLADKEGNLKEEYTMEGIHLWPNAYAIILENMKKYL